MIGRLNKKDNKFCSLWTQILRLLSVIEATTLLLTGQVQKITSRHTTHDYCTQLKQSILIAAIQPELPKMYFFKVIYVVVCLVVLTYKVSYTSWCPIYFVPSSVHLSWVQVISSRLGFQFFFNFMLFQKDKGKFFSVIKKKILLLLCMSILITSKIRRICNNCEFNSHK